MLEKIFFEGLTSKVDTYIHTYIHTCIHIYIHMNFVIRRKYILKYIHCMDVSSLDLWTRVDISAWTIDLGVQIL